LGAVAPPASNRSVEATFAAILDAVAAKSNARARPAAPLAPAWDLERDGLAAIIHVELPKRYNSWFRSSALTSVSNRVALIDSPDAWISSVESGLMPRGARSVS